MSSEREKLRCKLESYINACLPTFRLWGLDIIVTLGDDEEAYLTIDIMSYNYNTAEVEMHPSFEDLDSKRKVIAVAHELSHAVDAQLARFTTTYMKGVLPSGEYERWHKTYEDLEDTRVEEFARIIAPQLPPWDTFNATSQTM